MCEVKKKKKIYVRWLQLKKVINVAASRENASLIHLFFSFFFHYHINFLFLFALVKLLSYYSYSLFLINLIKLTQHMSDAYGVPT